MADDSQSSVLREYLISLGFKVDAAKEKKFDNSLARWDRGATKLSKSLVGVGIAAQVMVTEFAYRMEKLYYSSKLAESAAGNLQALNFGGSKIGISNMAGQVERFAAAIRSNPGLVGFVNSLGVKVTGRDKADVFTDLVDQWRKMPFYIASRQASLFGIGPDDLLLVEQGLDKMKEAQALRKQVAGDLGVDTEKAAEAGRDLMNEWRDVLMYVGLFKDAVILQALPAMQQLAGVAKDVLADWIKIVQGQRAATGITPASAQASGVTVDQQTEIARRLEEQKRQREAKKPEDMTAEERRLQGLDPATGQKPTERLTYREKTPEQQEKDYNPAERILHETLDPHITGVGGGVEMSDETKKRLGMKQGESTAAPESKSIFRKGWEKLFSFQKPFEPDAASVEAATAPDAVSAGVPEAVNAALVPAAPAPDTGQQPPTTATPGTRPPVSANQSMLDQLEARYALPKGLLDRVWKRESARGNPKFMLSPKGAKGHFGFMDGTAKQYGVKDPNDFKQSAAGAARYFADLLKKYGDVKFAAAAYNWGPDNLDKAIGKAIESHPDMSQAEVDKYVLGVLPKETKDYVNSVAGEGGATVTIHQENNYNITEAGNARDTAHEVGEQQRAVNADTVRQFTPRIN